MKLIALSLVIACQLSIFAPQAMCQDSKAQPEQLHLTIGAPGGHVALTASSMQRDLSSKASGSILKLRGNVEIKMSTCFPSGQRTVCEETMTIHADEADYNQNTGEIDPRGNVHMTAFPIVAKN